MEYLAIARKWRPQEFDDLIGQPHVVQTLKNAITLGRVSHAYLFCGARGVGKTSVARIFAKALRCKESKEGVPCHHCPECIAIAESRSVDVVEIDGASNNGVEAVRALRENVAYGAATGQYKIYIIDEVHMLSISAFNALLKTLEEPPPYVLFMFATTEVQKIPQTILSRVQRFEFRRLTQNQIIGRLKQVLSTEKIELSEDGIRLIASHADGSLRDALSLLDQVLSYFGGGNNFDAVSVAEALGVSGGAEIRAFIGEILQKNIPGILTRISNVYTSGMDLKTFSERVLEELRLLFLIVLSQSHREILTCESLDISPDALLELKTLAKDTQPIAIERMAQILMTTISQLGWCREPRFVMEMAAIRMTKLDRLHELEVPAEVTTEVQVPMPVVLGTSGETPRALARTPASSANPAAISTANLAANSNTMRPTPPEETNSDPQATWRAFVDRVMKKRPMLGALLSHANFEIAVEGNSKTVTLAFAPGSFYEKQACDQKNRKEIEDNLKLFFGPSTHFILTNNNTRTRPSLETARKEEENRLRMEALNHPSVQAAKQIFQAEVIEVSALEHENTDA